MFWFGTLQQEAIIPCSLVIVFKITLMFMFVERNQGTVHMDKVYNRPLWVSQADMRLVSYCWKFYIIDRKSILKNPHHFLPQSVNLRMFPNFKLQSLVVVVFSMLSFRGHFSLMFRSYDELSNVFCSTEYIIH